MNDNDNNDIVAKIDSLVDTIRYSDIVGQALSQLLTREYEEKIENLRKDSKKSDKDISIYPSVSPVDVLILALLYKLEYENQKAIPEEFEKMVITRYPELKYAYYYSIYRLGELGLIEKFKNPGYRLRDLGKEIVRKAITVKEEIEKLVSNDSLLGWIYNQEREAKNFSSAE